MLHFFNTQLTSRLGMTTLVKAGHRYDHTALDRLRKRSRDNRPTKPPTGLLSLRCEHNSLIREWSYKGTVSIPSTLVRGIGFRQISRSSREALELPPLFHTTLDLRIPVKSSPRATAPTQELRTLVRVMTARLPNRDTGRCGSLVDEPNVFGRYTLDELSTKRSSILEVDEDPFLAFCRDSMGRRESVCDSSVILGSGAGVFFCKEILRLAGGSDGLQKLFERIDTDGHNWINVGNLCDFFLWTNVHFHPGELKAVHSYLRSSDADPEADDCTPIHFTQRTLQLMKKFAKAPGLTVLQDGCQSDAVWRSEKYFTSRDFQLPSEPMMKTLTPRHSPNASHSPPIIDSNLT